MIKVGEYVRTDFGISKLIKKEQLKDCSGQIIYTFDKLDENLWSGDIPNEMWKSEIDYETEKYGSPFKKHSEYVEELIEKGDYINGHRVEVIWEDAGNIRFAGCDYTFNISDKDIKSIITKEQIEDIEYKLEDK